MSGHIGWLGFIVFGIVEGSLLLTILAAVLGRPRNPGPGKTPLVFVGSLVVLLATVVGGLWIGGFIFSLLMG